MEQQNEELSLATKVKIVGSMALVTALVVVSTVGVVTYQRNAKVEAAELAKTQLTNVEAMKTSFPRFRDTEEFKEMVANMPITKISVDDLPATITAGLDETVSPNPSCSGVDVGEPDTWLILKDGTPVANSGTPDGWSVSPDGIITIPDGVSYGKYKANYIVNDGCDIENFLPYSVYTYVFKITPPCPTGGVLTHTP